MKHKLFEITKFQHFHFHLFCSKQLYPTKSLQEVEKPPTFFHPTDPKTYSSILQRCADTGKISQGMNAHAHIVKTGIKQDSFLLNHLINMYAKCGFLEDAHQVFDGMPRRNVVSFTAMITGYVQNGEAEEALNIFHRMQCEGIVGNRFTFVSVMKASSSIGVFQVGEQLHAQFTKSGLYLDVVVGSSLVDMYAKCGKILDAYTVFDKMPKRNSVTWTALIMGYAQHGLIDEALKLFNQMPIRDLVSWNAMIVGLIQNGYSDEALRLSYEMQGCGMKADRITFACVLSGCANLATLGHGKQIHACIIKNGFELNAVVGSALLDMYAKCGSLDSAMEVFDKMPQRNVVSWTAIISAFGQHGRGRESLQLFEKMQEAGIKPNGITFVALLSACSYVGLVDEGLHYFDSMGKVYGISPKLEHYSCMVDLLGRAGLLDEAEGIIHWMPIEPTVTVWGALLSACRIHGNIELGRHSADQILQLKAQDGPTYVLLSNFYAGLGMWADVANVRNVMKGKGLKKQPGCSWIEVKNSIHVFISSDESHPQKDKIYAMLQRLARQMKDVGYVPNTSALLLDLDDKQKETLLWYHSEKLAIAFGIVATPPRTTIRVMKNLRICSDCHSAIELISKIVERQIIVRDANRFHHFQDGKCSCGKFW